MLPAGVALVAWAAANGQKQPKGWQAWLACALFGLVDGTMFQVGLGHPVCQVHVTWGTQHGCTCQHTGCCLLHAAWDHTICTKPGTCAPYLSGSHHRSAVLGCGGDKTKWCRHAAWRCFHCYVLRSCNDDFCPCASIASLQLELVVYFVI